MPRSVSVLSAMMVSSRRGSSRARGRTSNRRDSKRPRGTWCARLLPGGARARGSRHRGRGGAMASVQGGSGGAALAAREGPAAQAGGRDGRGDRGRHRAAASWRARSGCSSCRCSASAPRSAPASSSCSPRRCRSPGPAVVLSFVMAGVVAGLTAICYAELASAVPVSGSSYSYAYATLGEGVAMVVAACLLLEYGVSAAAVAVGWSQYLNEVLDNLFGFTIPESLSQAPEQGGVINLPAVILIVLCALAAAARRERVGEDQRDHGDDQDRRAAAVHRARPPGLDVRQPVGLHAVRDGGDHDGGGHHLLLLHRAWTPSRPPARR